MEKKVRGQIWGYRDLDSDKTRPCIIVGQIIESEHDITISKITSQDPRSEYDYYLENWEELELTKPSTVRCTKIQTINKRQLIFRIGTVEEDQLEEIHKRILKFLM